MQSARRNSLTRQRRCSNIRVHIAELQLPTTNEEVKETIKEVHETISKGLMGHIEGIGHTVLPLRDEDIFLDKKFADVIAETGACYYLRRKFNPERKPNWGIHNEGILSAFFHKNGIKEQSTIIAVKCSSEWQMVDEQG